MALHCIVCVRERGCRVAQHCCKGGGGGVGVVRRLHCQVREDEGGLGTERVRKKGGRGLHYYERDKGRCLQHRERKKRGRGG